MLKVPIKDAKANVRGSFRAEGSILQETIACAPEFAIELIVESGAPEETLQKIVRLAHAGCYAEASLSRSTPVAVSNTINGKRTSRKFVR